MVRAHAWVCVRGCVRAYVYAHGCVYVRVNVHVYTRATEPATGATAPVSTVVGARTRERGVESNDYEAQGQLRAEVQVRWAGVG